LQPPTKPLKLFETQFLLALEKMVNRSVQRPGQAGVIEKTKVMVRMYKEVNYLERQRDKTGGACEVRSVSFPQDGGMLLTVRQNLIAVSGFDTKGTSSPISLDSN
jgi:hypothetical protein